jgi:hypothetical protein
MPSFEEVELFLKNVRDKLQFNSTGIVYRPRQKIMDTLALLEIIPAERNEIIKKLTAENYYGGPKTDTYNPNMPDYYEFGVTVKGFEIYIKINMGIPNKPIDCMSFHQAEHPMSYPLKKENK